MAIHWSRRAVLGALSAGTAGVPFELGRPAFAQGNDLLAQLKKAGVIKIGLANQLPYSGMNPDGTLSGFVPILVQKIMASMGIPKVEGLVATYGELVPGLQAGRWHMIGAAFRLNKERCAQVQFADPVTFDGGAFAYLPGEMRNPPKSLAELGKAGTKIGVLQGSYLVKLAEDKGVDRANISQFPSNPAMLDGLMAKRAALVVSTFASLKELQRLRGGGFEVVYPVPDDPPVGSACAFRRDDKELHEVFQRELRALRASGELEKLGAQFGFETPPDLMNITADQACARVS